MENLPDSITTPRLTLRHWTIDDAAAINDAVTASIEHLRPWMEWIKFEPMTLADRQELIRSWSEGGLDRREAVYGVFHDGEVVGGCGLHPRIGPQALEIGYWIHVAHLRRGYATELSRGLTEAAFDIPEIKRVEIHHDKGNVPSAGVPRALGYTMVGEVESEIKAPAETGLSWVWQLSRADAAHEGSPD